MSLCPSTGASSFHSYDSDEEPSSRPTCHVLAAEPILESSREQPPNPEETREQVFRERDTASDTRFAASTEQQRNLREEHSAPNSVPRAPPASRFPCPSQTRARNPSPTRPGSFNDSRLSETRSFKPANLPKFDRKSNVRLFLKLYENSMYGAGEAMMDTSIINCLNSDTQTLIMPRLPEHRWTYTDVSLALIEEFGS